MLNEKNVSTMSAEELTAKLFEGMEKLMDMCNAVTTAHQTMAVTNALKELHEIGEISNTCYAENLKKLCTVNAEGLTFKR